jgi:hypothetical protein
VTPAENEMWLPGFSPEAFAFATGGQRVRRYGVGADHLVWAGQAGVLKDKELAGNMQKLSLWGWFAASAGLCTR